jgi:hypothetical protein
VKFGGSVKERKCSIEGKVDNADFEVLKPQIVEATRPRGALE